MSGETEAAEELRRLAARGEAGALEALLKRHEDFSQAALIAAFQVASDHQWPAIGRLLAPRIRDWRRVDLGGLPLVTALSMNGWSFALACLPGVEAVLPKPMPPWLIERLRRRNLRLSDGASAVDLAKAQLSSLQRMVGQDGLDGVGTWDRAHRQIASLQECVAWMKARVAAPEDTGIVAVELEKGDRVQVVLGPPKQRGLRGVIFWIGPSKRGPGIRVGIRSDSGQQHFVGAEEVELLEG
ncbi:MAG: hypothetical protein VX899_04595 [Myxococcota bacterium]|nr:hypothetical protein [Myxococcota bacterium]